MSVEVTITDVIKEVSKLDSEQIYIIKVSNDIDSEDIYELRTAMLEFNVRGLIMNQKIDFKGVSIDELIGFRNKIDEIIMEFKPVSGQNIQYCEDDIIKQMDEEE